MHPDAITRLRAANPAAVDPGLGREPVAQAALQQILDSAPETAPGARTIERASLRSDAFGCRKSRRWGGSARESLRAESSRPLSRWR